MILASYFAWNFDMGSLTTMKKISIIEHFISHMLKMSRNIPILYTWVRDV
jgi:hypothetical protein